MSDVAPKSFEQRAAEGNVAAVHDALGPFVVAAETSRMPMVFTDACAAGRPLIFANDAFLDLTGFARDEVLGQRFDFLLAAGPGSTPPELDAVFDTPTPGLKDPQIEISRRDGSQLWVSILASPVRDHDGTVIQHFASLIDLSARKAEAAHAQMLIDELNHRVKNMLATVQSIVAQALRGATDPAAVRATIEDRLSALSRSHDLLTANGWQEIKLHRLVERALEPFGVVDGRKERFEIDGDDIALSPRMTLALGIALHELATNAVKYGAFSNGTGCVRVSWSTAVAADRLVIVWEERDGPPVATPTRRGFGSRVIEQGLARELAGIVDLRYRPDGVVCTIDLPMPKG